jgi:hypothetical protein
MGELDSLKVEVANLTKQCHFFHMQVERMTYMFSLVQAHELKIYKLEHDGVVERKAIKVRVDDSQVDQLRGQ